MHVTPNSTSQRVAAIAVTRALDKELDYHIPDELAGRLSVGSQVSVPLGKTQTTGFVVGLKARSSFPKLRDITSLLADKPLIKPELMRLAVWMADYYVCPLTLVLPSLLPAPVRKQGARFQEIDFVRLVPDPPKVKLTVKQQHALTIAQEQGDMPLTALSELADVTRSVINKLEEKGYIAIGKKRIDRDPSKDDVLLPSLPLTLTAEQASSLALIKKGIDTLDPLVTLLYGITGSGKTEVYLQAMAHALDQGKSAIILVPEISLTPQTVERFRSRFGPQVAVLHSSLSGGERHDQWHRVASGDCKIVVGPRSALFAPVENLGLIVVDEEHESSYKQAESPMYHARDVAVMRGHLEGCAVVLGSATPSVETFQNTINGKYALSKLTERADDARLPAVRVVDMRIEAEKAGKPHLFSEDLLNAIRLRLDRQEQTILFLNRRGYATQCMCPSCGFVSECPHCSVAHTYFRKTHSLRCNMCGEPGKIPKACPQCRKPDFNYTGFGTEKIEAYLQDFFKSARIQRVDSDSMRAKDSFKRVMHAFRSGNIDVLVGTQMIAKGLHFPNVTLVGVIFADGTLHMPDFRAAERTFQLLTQVAGRAGRGDIAGEVLVQTYTPFHPAVEAARALDFDSFFAGEIEQRRAVGFPPFGHLSMLTVRGPDEDRVSQSLDRFVSAVQAAQPHPSMQIHGPMPSSILKVKDNFRYQAMFQGTSTKMITRPVRQVLETFKWPHKVKFAFDVDAVSLL